MNSATQTSLPRLVGATDIFLGASVPMANCIMILMLLAWGQSTIPARDLATLGVLFSMMMLWSPLRHSHQANLPGRIACWTLCLISGVFLAMLLIAGMAPSF